MKPMLKVCIGRHVCYAVLVQNGMKRLRHYEGGKSERIETERGTSAFGVCYECLK
jgi:hypothetical protein